MMRKPASAGPPAAQGMISLIERSGNLPWARAVKGRREAPTSALRLVIIGPSLHHWATSGASMIVDCHAHVFEHWTGPCGHPTREIHDRYLQRMITRTVASTFRARDWVHADTKALYRADDAGWSG